MGENKPFIVLETFASPRLYADIEKGIFEIKGKSLVEDVDEFYADFINLFDDYKNTPLDKTIIEIYFEYFNTPTSKIIVDLLMKAKLIHDSGKELEVIWIYDDDDPDMKGVIDDFKSVFQLNIQLKPVNN